MPRITLLAALICAAPAAATLAPAFAEGPVCARRAEYVDFLKRNRNETQERIALISERTLLELFVSPSGTWTVLTTTTTGLSCLARSGSGLSKFAAL
jgi:hypothetical protein